MQHQLVPSWLSPISRAQVPFIDVPGIQAWNEIQSTMAIDISMLVIVCIDGRGETEDAIAKEVKDLESVSKIIDRSANKGVPVLCMVSRASGTMASRAPIRTAIGL